MYARSANILERQLRSGRAVYKKRYVCSGWKETPEIVQARVAREAEIVARLESVPALAGRLGRVQLVEVDVDEAQLVVEEVPGRTVQEELLQSRRRTQHRSCRRALYLAGQWLRAFQTLPTDSRVPVDAPSSPEGLTAYCDLRLETLIELGYGWPTQEMRASVTRWIDECLQRTEPGLLEKVWCHCDFGPFNLIWDGQRLTPIDFSTSRLDLPLVDLTYLVHRIEMLGLQFPWRQWPLESWRRACLRGFGLPHADSLPVYRALMVRHLLCRLQSLVRRPPVSAVQALHNKWLRRGIQARLNGLLAQPPSTSSTDRETVG